MSIEIACPGCQSTLRVPDSGAGKQARCPQCQQVVSVPAASPATDLFGGMSTEPSPPRREASMTSASTDLFSEPLPAKPASGPTDMSNPYAASSFHELATPSLDAHDTELVPTRISFDDVFHLTWRIFQLHVGPLALLGLILFAAQAVQNGIGYVVNLLGNITNEPLIIAATSIGVYVFNFLVTPIVMLGGSMACLRLLRNGETNLGDFMKFVPFYGRCLLRDVLVYLMMLPLVICVAVPIGILALLNQPEAALIAGVALGLIAYVVMIAIFIGFYFSNFFMIDRNVGAIDSLKLSWRFMAGNRWPVLGLNLAIGLIGGIFAICCTCGLGLFLLQPYLFLMAATTYMLATGQRRAIATSLLTA